MACSLAEIDSLEAFVIIDNELDLLSPVDPAKVAAYGNLGHLAMSSPHKVNARGRATKELRMDQLCCAAWGLSIILASMLLPAMSSGS
jgi:7,8-dihydropterin-6-yl-methyl-4-(beta-D-ribofuranosyl)aminobenzene 5'-phosphate synthase